MGSGPAFRDNMFDAGVSMDETLRQMAFHAKLLGPAGAGGGSTALGPANRQARPGRRPVIPTTSRPSLGRAARPPSGATHRGPRSAGLSLPAGPAGRG